jgi:cytochrome c oxidase subunit 2
MTIRSVALCVAILVTAVGISFLGYTVWYRPSVPPIENLDAEVIADDYRFHFRYPGSDRVLGTADDRFGTRNLYLPEQAAVQLNLISRDYIYTLEIPARELYEAAVPDISFTARFDAGKTGTFELLGSQMCGYDHPGLLGKLIVQPAAEFERTMRGLSDTESVPPPGDSLK